MKILGYILVIFAAANFASSFADETKLKLRKVKNNNAGSENISIKINPEMFILKDLKELKNQYKATESFAKEMDKLIKTKTKDISITSRLVTAHISGGMILVMAYDVRLAPTCL